MKNFTSASLSLSKFTGWVSIHYRWFNLCLNKKKKKENAQSCPMKDFHVTVNDTMLKKTSISISAIFIGHFFLFTSFYDLYILPYLRGNLKLRNDHYFQIWIYLETYDQVIFKMAFSNQADLLHWSVGINFIQSFFFLQIQPT